MLHLVEELTNGSIEATGCWSDPLKLVPVLHLVDIHIGTTLELRTFQIFETETWITF